MKCPENKYRPSKDYLFRKMDETLLSFIIVIIPCLIWLFHLKLCACFFQNILSCLQLYVVTIVSTIVAVTRRLVCYRLSKSLSFLGSIVFISSITWLRKKYKGVRWNKSSTWSVISWRHWITGVSRGKFQNVISSMPEDWACLWHEIGHSNRNVNKQLVESFIT